MSRFNDFAILNITLLKIRIGWWELISRSAELSEENKIIKQGLKDTKIDELEKFIATDKIWTSRIHDQDPP